MFEVAKRMYNAATKSNRDQYQITPDMINKYNAQNIYTSRKYGAFFDGEKMSGGLNYATAFDVDRDELIERSLKAVTESPQAISAINRLNDSVINTGLMLESTPDATILGISAEQKQEISNKIESRFNLWANSKECDAQGNNTLGQIERILFNNQLVKGDYFVILDYSDNFLLQNPLQIRVIQPNRVSTPNNTEQIEAAKRAGNTIVEGIEIDENGRNVAIYISFKDKDTGQMEWQRVEWFSEGGRQKVIHGNKQKFGDEVRGIPALANIAHELEKITDYSLLELMAAVANATIANVVVPSENSPATNPLPSNTFTPPSLIKKCNWV